MKTMKYLWTLCLALAAFTFSACSDDDNGGSDTNILVRFDVPNKAARHQCKSPRYT